MNAAFQNQSCDPYTATDSPCELGNYASYSINVTSVDDVLAGITFAKDKNIRLVIKNTGHEYGAPSCAALHCHMTRDTCSMLTIPQ